MHPAPYILTCAGCTSPHPSLAAAETALAAAPCMALAKCSATITTPAGDVLRAAFSPARGWHASQHDLNAANRRNALGVLHVSFPVR